MKVTTQETHSDNSTYQFTKTMLLFSLPKKRYPIQTVTRYWIVGVVSMEPQDQLDLNNITDVITLQKAQCHIRHTNLLF